MASLPRTYYTYTFLCTPPRLLSPSLTNSRHLATDNFANRLHKVTQTATDRLNRNKPISDRSRARRALIVRGYKPVDEVAALFNILKDTTAGDNAAPTENWFGGSTWKLHLSATYWVLVMLRSPVVPPLHEDDALALHEGRRWLDGQAKFDRLRDLATCKISWEEYSRGEMVRKPVLQGILNNIWDNATVLCLTPALSTMKPFVWLKNERVQGIAVDEAGNISRPDLYRAWGNTLLPCVLAGDEKVCD